jgi:methionine-S-sulfoxide reductase
MTTRRFVVVLAALSLVGLAACRAEATPPFAVEKKKVTLPEKTETAILAGGCFWGMEEILRTAPGVLDIEAGYTGGWLENPKYDDTHDSKSGHAEAIKVIYDPTKISFATILDDWFFRMHDPTTKDRQGNDVGTQYRSAIFYTNPEQKKIAEEAKERANKSGRWKNPVVTSLEPFTKWWPAEGYHQDYLQKNPGGYTCHWMRS